MQLIVPNPINLCEYRDNFIEKEQETEVEIDMNPENECSNIKYNNNESDLIISPIKLK